MAKSRMVKQLAVVRLRGRTGLAGDVEATLRLLNIHRVNHCAVVDETPTVSGMLRKAKDYITWGTVKEETIKILIEKRGEVVTATDTKKAKKFVNANGKSYKPYFRLSPAKGGLGRKGIKSSFAKSGALGNRGEKINDLIMRML